MTTHDRYRKFERAMTATLFTNHFTFILYLISACAAIGWLKIACAIVSLILPVVGLGMLYYSRELTKPRSLWLSCGFFAIACCTLSSLILAYPG